MESDDAMVERAVRAARRAYHLCVVAPGLFAMGFMLWHWGRPSILEEVGMALPYPRDLALAVFAGAGLVCEVGAGVLIAMEIALVRQVQTLDIIARSLAARD